MKMHLRGQRIPLEDASGSKIVVSRSWSACGHTNNPDILTSSAAMVTCKRCLASEQYKSETDGLNR